MGNRGDLHASDGSLGRQWRSRRWISCVLDGIGDWKAPIDTPGHYYPLFFHDEAVALAAGHRPCGECRPDALAAFIAAWKAGHGSAAHECVLLREIDRACHQSRVSERRTRLTTYISDLPDGTFVFAPELDHRALLIFADHLWPWQHGGYGKPIDCRRVAACSMVLTPEPLISVLRMGYPTFIAHCLQRGAISEDC